MVKDRSIVRDGNHFIYLEGTGWVLIDGPWYRRIPPIYHQYRVRQWEAPPYLVEYETYPAEYSTKYITWEAVQWRPSLSHIIDKRLPLYWKYRGMVTDHRYRIGWRILPDGPLPALFNAIEWQDGMEGWLDELQKAYR